MSPPRPAPVVTGGDSRGELLALEVRLLGDLPLPFSALVRDPVAGAVLYSTDRGRVEAARAAGEVVLAPLELEAAAYAVQEGRAGRRDWLLWLSKKRARPAWRLSATEALGGAWGLVRALELAARPRRVAVGQLGGEVVRVTTPAEPRITLGRFLALVGAELVDVQVGAAPAEEGAAA